MHPVDDLDNSFRAGRPLCCTDMVCTIYSNILLIEPSIVLAGWDICDRALSELCSTGWWDLHGPALLAQHSMPETILSTVDR